STATSTSSHQRSPSSRSSRARTSPCIRVTSCLFPKVAANKRQSVLPRLLLRLARAWRSTASLTIRSYGRKRQQTGGPRQWRERRRGNHSSPPPHARVSPFPPHASPLRLPPDFP